MYLLNGNIYNFLPQGSKFFNWNAHEPNNLDAENCVEMNFMNRQGKWNDRRCSTLVKFICQKPASKKSHYMYYPCL